MLNARSIDIVLKQKQIQTAKRRIDWGFQKLV